MILIPAEIREKLLENGRQQNFKVGDDDIDFYPVVKLFNPAGAGTWLITELMPDGDTMFGLCDLAMGSPELGYVSLRELESVVLPWGVKIERDIYFTADKPISEYAREANSLGYINT